jgi:hypothetical protein
VNVSKELGLYFDGVSTNGKLVDGARREPGNILLTGRTSTPRSEPPKLLSKIEFTVAIASVLLLV